MTRYRMYQVDAFTDRLFAGNPAGVMPLEEWLPDQTLQAIAAENNLAETAFIIPEGPGRYHLRWFTPGVEVPLCGHATLATAHVLWTEEKIAADCLTFETLSGELRVERAGGRYKMDFPADPPVPIDLPLGMTEALEGNPVAMLAGQYLMARFGSQAEIEALSPDFRALSSIRTERGRGAAEDCVVATAPGKDGYDFVSRFFGPTVGIDEDPVTGSAHCMLAPYWAAELGKSELKARQISPRGGDLLCTVEGDRVLLEGSCVTYLRGEIELASS
ncbi:MAG: PhzF family phenazine biosynthesis protein [Pseudomonadota bacterium]